MRRIGLTGSIASGKSMVSDRLRALGAYVIDADAVSRALCAPGGEGLAQIVEAFGPEVLCADGTLHRKAMAERVFADERARRRLEDILHPLIRARMEELAAQSGEEIVFFDVPLLFETGMDAEMDQVWLVDAPEALRVYRMMRRDGCTREQAMARMAAQMTDAQKRALSDVVIQNDGTIAALYGKVDALWQSLRG